MTEAAAAAEDEVMSSPGSSRQRLLLRDLDRLDRRRNTEADERAAEDEIRRQRLQRVLARLSRIQDPRQSNAALPAQQQQSLYNDWAPANNEGQEESDSAASRRRQLYRRHDSLRSAAIMHNARTSARSPSAALRHSEETADPQHIRSSFRRGYLADNPSLESSSSSPSGHSPLLESAVKYLDEVRTCSSYDESLCSALDHGLFSPDNYDDLVTDPNSCPSPQPSSWLAPGAVFRGSQHTTTSNKDIRYSLHSPPPFDATRPWLSHVPVPPFTNPPATREVQDRWPVKVTIQAVDHQTMTMAGTMEAFDVPNTCSSVSSESCKQTAPITTYLEGQIIDLDIHTFLTPAMPVHSRDITFPPTTANTDAGYWRNLPPFNNMKSDQEVAHALLSQSQMSEIMSEWIFMRWKERCFIHSKSDPCHQNGEHSSGRLVATGEGDDTDTGHGLTISGFYYVSLRRSDGNIDGLYFDTKTSPYQHLKLEARTGGTLGAWQFK